MSRPPGPKKQQPPIGKEPINISDDEFWSTSSPPSSPSPCLSKEDRDIDIGERVELILKKGRKRQFSLEKGKENQEPEVRVKKPMPKPTTARASIPSSLLSPEQHL